MYLFKLRVNDDLPRERAGSSPPVQYAAVVENGHSVAVREGSEKSAAYSLQHLQAYLEAVRDDTPALLVADRGSSISPLGAGEEEGEVSSSHAGRPEEFDSFILSFLYKVGPPRTAPPHLPFTVLPWRSPFLSLFSFHPFTRSHFHPFTLSHPFTVCFALITDTLCFSGGRFPRGGIKQRAVSRPNHHTKYEYYRYFFFFPFSRRKRLEKGMKKPKSNKSSRAALSSRSLPRGSP